MFTNRQVQSFELLQLPTILSYMLAILTANTLNGATDRQLQKEKRLQTGHLTVDGPWFMTENNPALSNPQDGKQAPTLI